MRHARLLILAALPACGPSGPRAGAGSEVRSTIAPQGDDAGADAAPTAAPTSGGPCPHALTPDLHDIYWAHDLFPGCPPPPFTIDGVACAGTCPQPCREVHRELPAEWNSQGWEKRFTYVDGRLATVKGATAATSVYTHTWDDTLHYEGGRLTGYTTPLGTTRIVRDPQGRITTVEDKLRDARVTYGADGRISTLEGRQGYLKTALRYDQAGRLVAEESLQSQVDPWKHEYTYDPDGRVVGFTVGKSTWRYDATTGLLAERRQLVSFGNRLGDETLAFVYDLQHRPIRVTRTMPGGTELEYTYDYDCVTPGS